MDGSDIRQELKLELIENEDILWVGQPKTGIVFKKSDIIAIPFSLLWSVLVLTFFINEISKSGFSFFSIYLGIFLLAGLYGAVGRFFYNSMRRSKIMYGITPTRIIIKSSFMSEKFDTYDIATLPDVLLFARDNGSGTVVLSTYSFYYYRMSMSWSMYKLPAMLEEVDNVKDVYDLILKLKNTSN